MPTEPPDEALAVRAVRRHVRRHNWQALMLSVFAFVAAAILWGVVYLIVYWFALVIATLSLSFNPKTLVEVTNTRLLGPYYPLEFIGGAVVVMMLAMFFRRRINPNRLRERRLYVLWIAFELFMAIPNVTFSVWGNLRAIVRLRRGEALAAWRFLEHVRGLGGRLALVNIASEIEDQETLPHLLVLLQVAELLGVRENEDGWFYYLQNTDALARLMPAPQAVGASESAA